MQLEDVQKVIQNRKAREEKAKTPNPLGTRVGTIVDPRNPGCDPCRAVQDAITEPIIRAHNLPPVRMPHLLYNGGKWKTVLVEMESGRCQYMRRYEDGSLAPLENGDLTREDIMSNPITFAVDRMPEMWD